MLAVIKTGGKQYLVQPGDKIKVEKLDVEEGKEITFSEVLLYINDKNVEIGSPVIKDVKVKAKVLSQTKGEKLIIFKYKPKKRYKRKIGHRQKFTEVEIIKIEDK